MQVQVTIPEFLTVRQYLEMNSYKGDSKIGKMISTVSGLTGYSFSDVQKWDMPSLVKIANMYADIADHKNEFHSLIEWNGQLYGYSSINSFNLGCYMDMEMLTKEFDKNLHKVAALLYRPVKSHKFDTLEFAVKQKVKMVNNDVENVFDWYTIEEYDSDKRKEVEESFKAFPVHILLGAISFF